MLFRGPFEETVYRPASWLTNPPGHLWRDTWTALSGPLSSWSAHLQARVYAKFKRGSSESFHESSPPHRERYRATLVGLGPNELRSYQDANF